MNTLSRQSSRGITEAVGYMLLLTIIVIGVSLIIFMGGGAVSDLREDTAQSQSEQAFTQFDSVVESVAMADHETQREHTLGVMNQGGGMAFTETGQITVGVDRTDDGTIDETLIDESMRSIIYQHSNYEIVYQNGAVFRLDVDTGERDMVSPPSLRTYEEEESCAPAGTHPIEDLPDCSETTTHDKTISLSVVTLDADSRIGDTMYVLQTETTESEMLGQLGEDEQLIIEIESEYHEQWGNYAEENIDGATATRTGTQSVKIAIDNDETSFAHIVHATIGLQ